MESAETRENQARAAEAVSKGAELLDDRLGPDWPRKLDLDELDLCSIYHCVLGQLYDDYWEGTESLWPDAPVDSAQYCCSQCDGPRDEFEARRPTSRSDLARRHGFLAGSGYSAPYGGDLEAAWRSTIERLRTERRPAEAAQ